MKYVRYLVPVAVVALLALTGMVDLSILPWRSGDFQASLATVFVYLLWSASGDREGSDRTGIYTVLLVSAVDSFLLRLAVFQGLLFLRWAGVVILIAGCALRTIARRSSGLLRAARVMQLAGLPLGFGTLAGLAVALFPGLVFALKEDVSR
jgi:hypothetical protein